jgi:FtsH-binding integral membrane protein
MASIGLILAILANAIFFQSAMFSLLTSVVVVLLFSAVTAYETQVIKEMYYEGDDTMVAKQKSIFGAFMLYGSFVTLFVNILNILGIMRSE